MQLNILRNLKQERKKKGACEMGRYLKVGDLKKALENISDDVEVFVHNVVNPCGNISELGKVEETTYSVFGELEPCVILKSVLLVQGEQ
jgi:hypothetical protein